MGEQVVVRDRGEGDAVWMLGGLYEIKARAEETGGSCSVLEVTVPEGMGPPPHVHDGGEAVYVLEGSATYHIEGRAVEAGPGSFLYFPKGCEETFQPHGMMRVLIFYTPGGMDRFFDEVGEPAARREVPPTPDGPPDLERLTSVGRKYGLELRVPQQA